jgi:predicted nucleic acid-binding protein
MLDESTKQTTYCIDASFMLSILLPDEKDSPNDTYIDGIKDKSIKFIAPHLLSYEVTNVLRMAVVRERISEKEGTILLTDFKDLPMSYFHINLATVFQLSLQNKLTVYDASYLSIALSHKCQLLTFDKELVKAYNFFQKY